MSESSNERNAPRAVAIGGTDCSQVSLVQQVFDRRMAPDWAPVGALIGVLLGGSVLIGCASRTEQSIAIPEATAFETPPEFAGEWVGEIGTIPGVLNVGELGAGRYYGAFRADVGLREFVLLMEQSTVQTVGGGNVPSNRILFTWQDGQGSRGRGWVLINREETALAGSFGLSDAYEGEGDWTFVRISE